MKNVTKAGFPELTHPSDRCKLCTLSKAAPQLLHQIHDLYAYERVKVDSLYKRVEAMFQSAQQERPSITSFRRHLSKHVNAALVDRSWRTVMPTKAPVHSALMSGSASTELDGSILGDDEVDYQRVRRVLDTAEQIVNGVAAQLLTTFNDPKNGDDGKSASEKSGVVGFNVNAYATSLNALLKGVKLMQEMRESDRFLRSALDRHTETLVHSVASALAAPLVRIVQDLRAGADPEKVADSLQCLVTEEVKPLFEQAAQSAIQETAEMYKLTH